MPERNPFEETMRAGQMNVPQRTVRPTMRDVAGPVRTHEAAHQGVGTGFGGGRIGYYEDPTGPTRPPGQPMSGRHTGYGGPRPIRAGVGGGPIMGYEDPTGPTRPPGQPVSGRHRGYGGPQPVRSGFGMGSGSYLSSGYGGGLDDAAGMNDDARGMIEGAGFDVAGKTTDDRVSEKLWGKAVNNFPPGTPDMIIQQEWERLKKIYFDSTYGSPTLPSRGDIVGLG